MTAKKKKKARKKTAKKRRSKKPSKKATRKKSKVRKSKVAKKKNSSKQKTPTAHIIGVVTHYFPHVQAAVVKLKKPLAVGDTILLKGSTTDFEQRVESMQIDHVAIQKASKGDEIGLQVRDRVREHDLVLFPS